MPRPFDQLVKRHRGRTLFGGKVEQTFAAVFVLEKLLANYRPTLIVELGTGTGYLTAYFTMYAILNEGVKIRTYDIKPRNEVPDKLTNLTDGRIKFLKQNFHDPEVLKSICKRVNASKRPFIFVDGADPKSDEVNMYAPGIKKGTVVFAHDCILDGHNKFHWGYTEDKINWKYYERYEPYYTWSDQADTRTICLRKI